MIVKIPLVLALVTYIQGILSASFSKVYVQNGPDYPVEYSQYGAPSVPYSQHIAQLNAAPVGSVVPYSPDYVPCGTPCIYPGVASVAPSTQIVQYQPPSLSGVVTKTRSEPSGYEYSYVVYDEQTGDHKAQRELSDGNMVRGGYSFLQPDGYIREVQYVADDVQGFNAVVKNYLPVTVETKKRVHAEKPVVEPCHEIPNDHLNEEKGHHETHQKTSEEHGRESDYREPSHDNLKAHHGEHHTEATGDKKHDQPLAEHHDAPHKELNEAHKESHEKHSDPEVEPHKEHHDTHTKPVEELIVVIEENHVAHDEPHGVHREVHVKHRTEETQEKNEPENHEEFHEEHESYGSHSESVQEEAASLKESESGKPEVHENHEHHLAVAEHDIKNSNVLVPYNDLIRCLKATLSGVNDSSSPHKAESPLTYIILNKPC